MVFLPIITSLLPSDMEWWLIDIINVLVVLHAFAFFAFFYFFFRDWAAGVGTNREYDHKKQQFVDVKKEQ